MSPGPLSARKGVNVTYARPELPAITEKDIADLALAAELDADFVALSFVRSADDVEQLRAHMGALTCRARMVAKIEKVEAYEHLDEIIEVADGIMVARGDYGVEAGVAHVPLMQKDTIARATQAGKLVITATQMLESMIHAPEPTRAEATDVANAVIDGSSAVMLSAETSVGELPRRGGPGDGRDRRGGRARARDPRPRAHRQAGHRRRRPSCTPPSSSPSELDAGRPRRPDRDRRGAAGVREVPLEAARSSRSRTTGGSPTRSRSSGASTATRWTSPSPSTT